MILLLNFFIGSILGSHALVIVERNYNKSFAQGFSKCDTCDFPLTLFDQIPIFSFILKHGRCSHCHQPIPLITFWVELFSGLIFSDIYLFSSTGFINALFLFFFLICSIFDYYYLEFETILLILPAIIAFLSPNSAIHGYSGIDWLLLSLLLILMLTMNFRGKFGMGDTLFFLLISLYRGQTFGLHTLLLASIIFLLLYPFHPKHSELAFLPFLLVSYSFISLL